LSKNKSLTVSIVYSYSKQIIFPKILGNFPSGLSVIPTTFIGTAIFYAAAIVASTKKPRISELFITV